MAANHTQVTRNRQRQFLLLRARGLSIAKCMAEIGLTKDAYYKWKKNDPIFVDMEAQAFPKEGDDPADLTLGKFMDLRSFRSKILGRETYAHMENWDEWFEDEDADHIAIFVPPECAKTTFVADKILHLIYRNPDIQIGYGSRSLSHARKQVGKIRAIIEANQTLNELCGNLVPGKDDPHPWREDAFTVRTRSWDIGKDQADYTLAAYGAGSQITGSRFDLLIWDDPDDVHIGGAERDKIWDVILQSGETRLGTSGRTIVIGNRQAHEDVYQRILDQEEEDPGLWKINVQSAVTYRDGKPVDCIWPEKFGLPKTVDSKKPVKRDGPWTLERALEFFDRKRRRLKDRFWLVYQNDPLPPEGMDFTREMVDAALNGKYSAKNVPSGSTMICMMDPAPVGGAAVIAYAILPPDDQGIRRRLLVDIEIGRGWRTAGCKERIMRFGRLYKPRYWAIDRQGSNRYLTDDLEVQQEIRSQGAVLCDLTTGASKEQGDFRVSDLRSLFIGEQPKIILPASSDADREMTIELRDQFVNYVPGTKKEHDGPMGIWYGERVIQEKRLDEVRSSKPKKPSWQSPYGDHWKIGAGWGGNPLGR